MQPLSLVTVDSTPDLPDSDEQLVASALQGEQNAFEAIMRRNNRLLFRAARGVVFDDAEAQDVVQETYLRAFTRLRDFQGDASLGTWMARIAINVALDMLRRRKRSVPLDPQGLDQETSPEHMLSFTSPQGVSPDSMLARSQLRGLLQSAIEGLPPIYRSVFILRAVQELSVEEAAYCLQVSDAVVKTRYRRARSMLREALEQHIEAHATGVFAFAGARCDQVVDYVVAELHERHLIARH